ncbi:MAG: DUF2853 family protein [Deltaproteobacteria bacterium]
MSKREELLAKYADEFKKMNIPCDMDLLTKVTVALGPSIYNDDSSTVSCSDEAELQRLIDNFLVKKLGLGNSNDELMAGVKEVCAQLGTSNRNKYRAMFYYLLVKKFKKESAY